jgi:hypothetical protein
MSSAVDLAQFLVYPRPPRNQDMLSEPSESQATSDITRIYADIRTLI